VDTSPVLRCQECGAETETGEGWRAYLTIDDETAVYCPACARREFGDVRASKSV